MSDITFDDIKKAYFNKSVPKTVTLCYSGKTVFVKGMKLKDKKELLKALEKEDEIFLDMTLDSIIHKNVSDSNNNQIVTGLLTEEERQQLYLEIRKASTQEETIEIDHSCPKCKAESIVSFNFDKIVTSNFKKPETGELITSANGNVKFLIGQITRQDRLDIDEYKKLTKVESEVESDLIMLASTIREIYLSIDDIDKKLIPTLKEKIQFMDSMTLDDIEKIRSYLSKINEYGSKAVFEFKCPKCQYENKEEELPLANFFIK